MTLSSTTRFSVAVSPHKALVANHFDRLAADREKWRSRNAFYYRQDLAYMRFLAPPGLDVLELGCGTGSLLAGLEPARGVGVDISGAMIAEARSRFPLFEFIQCDVEADELISVVRGTFDVVVLSDTIGYLDDIQATLLNVRRLLRPNGRVVIAYYSWLWEPILRLGVALRWRMPNPQLNWLSTRDIMGLVSLGDLEPVRREWRQLIPRRLFGAGTLVNRYIAPLPLVRRLCLRSYVVAARGGPPIRDGLQPSVSILIPCRNESGNIEPLVKRIPRFVSQLEIVFIEGNSSDGTYDECVRVRDAFPDLRIVVLKQRGKGKGDAMRTGYAVATGDVLIVLDADQTVPPETLPKFYDILASGKADFVNGTRLIYPYERGAMRRLNAIANRAFAAIFSYLINQKLTDTLCGTKAFWASDYRRMADGRSYFGDFDPFGDFDLLLGASKLNLRIVELPIRYKARTYGDTQIARFRDGWLLLKMSVFAWRKLKAW